MKTSILETITDFLNYPHEDTVWISDHETILDRLAKLYIESGGTEIELGEIWPEYFGD